MKTEHASWVKAGQRVFWNDEYGTIRAVDPESGNVWVDVEWRGPGGVLHRVASPLAMGAAFPVDDAGEPQLPDGGSL